MMNTSGASLTKYPILQPCFVLRILGVYLIFLWCIGVWFNGKIIWIFIHQKKLRQSSSHVLVMGLIIADIVAILFELPIAILSTLSCR